MQKIIDLASVVKIYGDKTLFEIKHLEVFEGDRIGIIGANGSGKSTLMKLIAGEIMPDQGVIEVIESLAYMPQPLGSNIDEIEIGSYSASLFDVGRNAGYSGGEKTKRALSNVLSQNKALYLLDEPTTNMDLVSIQHLESEVLKYSGTLIVISHDTTFLNTVVNRLWILDGGTVREFDGTYEMWQIQQQREYDYQAFLYQQDQKERKRLEKEAARIRIEAQKVGKKPKHMSSKEARIYAGIASVQQGHVQRRSRQLLSRMDHKETLKRPESNDPINISLGSIQKLRAKTAITLENFNLAYGERVLFKDTNATLKTNVCSVITGPNGCGKTSLINAILRKEDGIVVNPGIHFGVFSQFHQSIDLKKTLLQNVMRESIYDMGKVRTILNNLRFSKEDLDKTASKLSGGERAKCVLAMLIVSDINALILDEPSNHLDMDTQQAMLDMLENWEHTLILVSHDRWFIDQLGDQVFEVKHQSLVPSING